MVLVTIKSAAILSIIPKEICPDRAEHEDDGCCMRRWTGVDLEDSMVSVNGQWLSKVRQVKKKEKGGREIEKAAVPLSSIFKLTLPLRTFLSVPHKSLYVGRWFII